MSRNKAVRKSSCMINFMVTPEEKAEIEKKIASSRLTKKEFMLRAIFDKPVVVLDDSTNLIRQLTRVGNNLNQALRNVYLDTGNSQEIIEAERECKEVVGQIKDLIRGGKK